MTVLSSEMDLAESSCMLLESLKGSHRMGADRNLQKISVPVPLIRTFRMYPLLASHFA
jgi:hypothetical protein